MKATGMFFPREWILKSRKNSKPATITIKIKFLYNLARPIDPDLALDLKINKIIIMTAKTINNRIISFFYI